MNYVLKLYDYDTGDFLIERSVGAYRPSGGDIISFKDDSDMGRGTFRGIVVRIEKAEVGLDREQIILEAALKGDWDFI